jgi:hypothetical protein
MHLTGSLFYKHDIAPSFEWGYVITDATPKMRGGGTFAVPEGATS